MQFHRFDLNLLIALDILLREKNVTRAAERAFVSQPAMSAALQKLCRYQWLFNFVVNKAIKSPSLRHTISAMFTNMDLRDQLRKPSFYLKILFNR